MVCIYHSRDLDGWMSAAIVKLYAEQHRYCSVCGRTLQNGHVGSTECCGGITTMDELTLIGWDYGQPIPELNPETEDSIIMVDISFPAVTMRSLACAFNLVWIDHHKSAIDEINAYPDEMGGYRDVKFAACELTWKYFFPDQEMPEIVRLLGRYDCFGHKGTDEELKVLEFQYGARANFFDPETCYQALKDWNLNIEHSIQVAGYNIYNYLCVEARQTYSMIFTIDIDGYKFACVNQVRFNPINFGIDYHTGGYDGFACFHFQNGQFTYSLYNDNGNVDCSELCKRRGGGGHKGAAGFLTDTMLPAIEKT